MPGEQDLKEPNKRIAEFYQYQADAGSYSWDEELRAEDLISHANAPEQSVATRYALLMAAAETAMKANNPRLMFRTVETLAEQFEVNSTATKTDLLIRFSASGRQPRYDEARDLFFAGAVEVLDEAVDNEDMEQIVASVAKFTSAAEKITVGRSQRSRKRFEGRVAELKKLADQTGGFPPGRFLDEFTCVLAEFDDHQRTIKYIHPEDQLDDALHATNYAQSLAQYAWTQMYAA